MHIEYVEAGPSTRRWYDPNENRPGGYYLTLVHGSSFGPYDQQTDAEKALLTWSEDPHNFLYDGD